MTAVRQMAGDEMLSRFRRDGYAVMPGIVSRTKITAIQEEIAAFFAYVAGGDMKDAPFGTDAFFQRLFDLFETDFTAYHGAARLANHAVSLHRLGTDPDLMLLLRRLGVVLPVICARPVVWFHSPRLARTARYHKLPAHQEWSNMQGSIDGAVIWTPLLPVSEAMGRLQVIPGSHLGGLRPLAPDDAGDYPLAMSQAGLRDADFVEVDVPVGGVLVFSPFLIHRSGENRSEAVRITANFRINNAADPSFARRDFINPFTYEAPTRLLTPDFPDADLVRRYYE